MTIQFLNQQAIIDIMLSDGLHPSFVHDVVAAARYCEKVLDLAESYLSEKDAMERRFIVIDLASTMADSKKPVG